VFAQVSFLDIFAVIVLVVLVATLVAILVALGMLPGRIARKRGHPWAEAVAVGSWATLIFGVVLWPLVLMWAYVDLPQKPQGTRPPRSEPASPEATP
jgi:NADH:ubiquinone oxidoreductase subunit 6 (subunit J)